MVDYEGERAGNDASNDTWLRLYVTYDCPITRTEVKEVIRGNMIEADGQALLGELPPQWKLLMECGKFLIVHFLTFVLVTPV